MGGYMNLKDLSSIPDNEGNFSLSPQNISINSMKINYFEVIESNTHFSYARICHKFREIRYKPRTLMGI